MFAIAAALALVMDQPPATTADDSASLRRIGAALAKPSALVVKAPLPEPTYRVEIRQHPYFTEVPLVWTFAGGGVPTTQASANSSDPLRHSAPRSSHRPGSRQQIGVDRYLLVYNLPR